MSILKNKKCPKKIIVITGGANGLGRDLVSFWAETAVVIILDQDERSGSALKQMLNQKHLNSCYYFDCDLADVEAIHQISNQIEDEFGYVDVLINNARPRLDAAGDKFSIDSWHAGIDILLSAPFFCIKFFLPLLNQSSSGSIINISSTNSRMVSAQPFSYGVAKAGLEQLTKYVAQFATGVRINSISPGILDVNSRATKFSRNPEMLSIFKRFFTTDRLIDSRQVFEVCRFLADDSASAINGQSITIDSGMSNLDQFYVAQKCVYGKD